MFLAVRCVVPRGHCGSCDEGWVWVLGCRPVLALMVSGCCYPAVGFRTPRRLNSGLSALRRCCWPHVIFCLFIAEAGLASPLPPQNQSNATPQSRHRFCGEPQQKGNDSSRLSRGSTRKRSQSAQMPRIFPRRGRMNCHEYATEIVPRSKLLQLGSTLLLSTFFEWGSLKKGSTPKQIPVAYQGHKQEKGCRASKVTRQVNGRSPTNFGLVVPCNYACKGHCVQIVVSTFNPLAFEWWSHGRVLNGICHVGQTAGSLGWGPLGVYCLGCLKNVNFGCASRKPFLGPLCQQGPFPAVNFRAPILAG